MKKLFIFLVFLIIWSLSANGQVGINTNNPEQTVHVAGQNDNVRVEGLNYPNNPNNLGPGSTTRVFVNHLGNLVLGTAADQGPLIIDSANYLQDIENQENVVIQKGHGEGYSAVAVPIDWTQYVFTLESTAIVEVNYSVSWNIYDNNSSENRRLDDNRARVVHTGMYFMKIHPDDLGCNTPYCGQPESVQTCDPNDFTSNCYVVKNADDEFINGGPWCILTVGQENCNKQAGLVGLNGQYYANSSLISGAYKDMRTAGADYVKLPPGQYLALFACKLEVDDTIGQGSAKMWLGPGNDEVQIRIYYLN